MISLRIFLPLIFLSATVPMTHAQQNAAARTVAVNGITLSYETYGQGTPLLLLHGWTQSAAFWQPYLNHYADTFEVYAVDLRGHGKSTPLSDDFTIAKAARDIAEFIRQLRLREVRAIGLSYGGLVLLELARAHPDLVESMVLIGTTNRYNGKESQAGKPAFTYETLDPSFVSYLNQQHAHGETHIRALFNPDLDYRINITTRELAAIRTRILIINGDSDEMAGIGGAVEMHRYLPNSALWIIPRTGHLAITEETREEFIRRTKAFLRE
jgi:pimeloyl-ACP methyl ester carboxylesterase